MQDYESYFRERLSKSIHKVDVDEMACLSQGKEGNPARQALYELLFDKDNRVANNAAWVFCNFDLYSNEWLYPKHDELIDEAMRTSDNTKRRLLLVLLLRQPFDKENLRTDFLDFCLGCISSDRESISVRTLSIKLAYEQCRFYPDLMRELRSTLELLQSDLLPTGVRTVRKKTLVGIGNALKQGK